MLYGPERQGALFAPVVLDHVDYRSELVMQETFGPPIIRCNGLDDVIAKSNATAFGLSRFRRTSPNDRSWHHPVVPKYGLNDDS